MELMLSAQSRRTDTRFNAIWGELQKRLGSAVGVKTPAADEARGADSRPFQHPFYWGGFVYTGL